MEQPRINQFVRACMINDINTVRSLVSEGYDFHLNNEEGFRLTCYHGYIQLTKYFTLLYKSANDNNKYDIIDIHANDEEGFNYACFFRRENVIRYLIKLSMKLPYSPINIYAAGDYHLTCMDGRYPKKYILNLGNYKKKLDNLFI